MHRRLRASARLRSALLAALFGGLIMVVPALAYTSDVNDFNLTETTHWYGPGTGTEFHVSTGGASVTYQWLDSPSKATVISSNNCGDYALLGSPKSYSQNDTSVRTLWGSGLSQQCFVLQGRTQAGEGTMNLHDGRLVR